MGLSIAYRNVLPALFPAAVICGMIGERAEYLPLPATTTLWLTAQICGFPLGVKTAVRAYQRELISKEQCTQLSCCCANASPAFLIPYLGLILFNDLRAGLLLYGAQVGISFLIAFHYGIFSGEPPFPTPPKPMAAILTQSIGDAASGCLTLTGFIASFSALAALCKSMPRFSYWYGLLELTGGISALPRQTPLWYCGALVGFSGVSVLLQNSAFLMEVQLSPLPMIGCKGLYALAIAFAAAQPVAAFFFFFFILFLISFDKLKKKRYNKLNTKKEWRRL